MPAAVTALGERAVVAIGASDWDQAGALVDAPLGSCGRAGWRTIPTPP